MQHIYIYILYISHYLRVFQYFSMKTRFLTRVYGCQLSKHCQADEIRGLVLFLVFLAAAIPFMVFGALGTVLDSVMNFRLFVISAAFGFCSIPCAFSAYHAATVPLSRCKGPTNMPNSTFNQLHRQYPGIHWQYLEGTESDESNVVVAAFQATLVAADSEAGTN